MYLCAFPGPSFWAYGWPNLDRNVPKISDPGTRTRVFAGLYYGGSPYSWRPCVTKANHKESQLGAPRRGKGSSRCSQNTRILHIGVSKNVYTIIVKSSCIGMFCLGLEVHEHCLLRVVLKHTGIQPIYHMSHSLNS